MRVLHICLLAVFLSACSSTAAPISTPTVTATRKPLPTSTPKPVTLSACVTDSTIRIRSGPGIDYDVIGGLVSGTCITILGRNQDSTWAYIVTDDKTTGWVAAWLLTINGELSRVSVQYTNLVDWYFAATNTPSLLERFAVTDTPQAPSTVIPLCSQTTIGQRVTCKIARAYCDYLPNVNGAPTFCDDRPYPNNDFQLVVFGEDWSDYDGACIIVTGLVGSYGGKLQILATSRSQVSYC
jgi:hypothetical protein